MGCRLAGWWGSEMMIDPIKPISDHRWSVNALVFAYDSLPFSRHLIRTLNPLFFLTHLRCLCDLVLCHFPQLSRLGQLKPCS